MKKLNSFELIHVVGGVDNPAQQAKAEAEQNPEAFAEKYGTNFNKANAFGMAVSSFAQAE